MHECTHQYHNTGEQRISIVPASIKSLPHTSSLNNHSSCVIGKYGEAMETIHQTDGQNMTTIDFSPTEASSSNSIVISTRGRTQQFKKYPHFLPTTYFGSHSSSQEGTFIWWTCSLYQGYEKKSSTLLGGCTKLVSRNRHNQGC